MRRKMRSKLQRKRKYMTSSPIDQHDKFNDIGGLTERGS
jgi:hypothetical protein